MTGGGEDHESVDEVDLWERMDALEFRLAALSDEIRTRRLVLAGPGGTDRLVAEVVAGVAELRLDLPGRPPGHRSSLLVFAAPEQRDWCAGLGVQLWVDGNLVDEMTWWQDQGEGPDDWPPVQSLDSS